MIIDKARAAIKSTAQRMVSLLTSPQSGYLIAEPLFRLLGRRNVGRGIDPSQVRRVLVVRLDEIGDVVMTTPFLRELRRLLPTSWITLVVKPALRNLVEFCPYINEVLTYDWQVPRYWCHLQRSWRALRLSYRHLFRRRFDLAVVPRWDADYYHAAFLAYLSGALWRVGYSENVIDHKRRLNHGFDRLFTHVLDNNSIKHEVEHNLDVIRFLGGTIQAERLELWLGAEDEAFANQVLFLRGVQANSILVAFGPGAGAPNRMWPLLNFVKLGNWLKRECHGRIVVVGAKGEELLGQELQRQLGDTVINVVAQSTIRQTGALLRYCHLYVGNNTGPMHLAAAAGVPVIDISCHPLGGSPWRLNSPRRFSPWGVPHRVLQPERPLDPCSEACTSAVPHCIRGVTVEQVKEAVVAQLSHRARPVLQDRAPPGRSSSS